MRSKILAALAAVGLAVPAGVSAQDMEFGEELYMQYCATCHGDDATGVGPLTELLTVKVPDLTQMSAENDGEFPMLATIHVIDGRTGVRAHGGPMPVYGRIFQEGSEEEMGRFGSVLETRGRVLSLAMYLESLQK